MEKMVPIMRAGEGVSLESYGVGPQGWESPKRNKKPRPFLQLGIVKSASVPSLTSVLCAFVAGMEVLGDYVRRLHLTMNTYESTNASGWNTVPVRGEGRTAYGRANGLRSVSTPFRGETATAAQAARLTQALGRWVPSNQSRRGAYGFPAAA